MKGPKTGTRIRTKTRIEAKTETVTRIGTRTAEDHDLGTGREGLVQKIERGGPNPRKDPETGPVMLIVNETVRGKGVEAR